MAGSQPVSQASSAAVAGKQPPLQQQQQRQRQQQRGQGSTKLRQSVAQRHRERSRLSADSQHSGRPHMQSGVTHPGSNTGSSSTGGGDALSAFEHHLQQQLEQDEGAAPSLESSPTVLALGAWQRHEKQQPPPDALYADATVAVATAGLHKQCSGSNGSGSGGGGFCIPRCPSGRVLELRISSTWGDHHYVGLAGIELFDDRGLPLSVRCVCIMIMLCCCMPGAQPQRACAKEKTASASAFWLPIT
jgi:hypothetical protein